MLHFNKHQLLFLLFCFSLLIWSDCVGYCAAQLNYSVAVDPLRTCIRLVSCYVLCVGPSSLLSKLAVRLVTPSHAGL